MEVIHTTKIIKTGSSLAIVIPVNILREMNWQRGDVLVFAGIADNMLGVKRPSDKELRALKGAAQLGGSKSKH